MGSASDPARLYHLATLLAKDRVITSNGRALLKELILRRDERLLMLTRDFEAKDLSNMIFVNAIHELIEAEAHTLYLELFEQCPLEVAKSLSKAEREAHELVNEKSLIYGEIDFQYILPRATLANTINLRYFARVLRKINPTKGCKFYDLGSGSSKALFVARHAAVLKWIFTNLGMQ